MIQIQKGKWEELITKCWLYLNVLVWSCRRFFLCCIFFSFFFFFIPFLLLLFPGKKHSHTWQAVHKQVPLNPTRFVRPWANTVCNICIFPRVEMDVCCAAAPVKRFRLCYFGTGKKCSSWSCSGLLSSFLLMLWELSAAVLKGASWSSAWVVHSDLPRAVVTGMLNSMYPPVLHCWILIKERMIMEVSR